MLDTTERKLQDIIRGVLELPPDAQVTDLRADTHPGWDSLAHTTLVGAIEGEFGFAVDVADSLELTSYPALARFLEARGL